MKLLTGVLFLSISTLSIAGPINPIESSGTISDYTTPPFFVIGIYEPNNEHGWETNDDGTYYYVRERGEGTVYIEEQSAENITLALGSYEPTDWEIKGPGADKVNQVIIFGYYSSTISGQNVDTVVFDRTYESGDSDYIKTFYSWDNNQRDTSVYELEEIANSKITSFSGVYNAESFHIDSH